MPELAKYISNADVAWEADFVGLAPRYTDDGVRRILEKTENPIPELVLVLTDPEKFVAAHVLLTQLVQIEHEVSPTWNGLTVDIAADGTVTIPSKQRQQLARRWRLWFETTPRPKKLPLSD